MKINWSEVVKARNGQDQEVLTISVDGQKIASHRFLVWLSDHVMACEIAKLDPFVDPYRHPRIGGYRD